MARTARCSVEIDAGFNRGVVSGFGTKVHARRVALKVGPRRSASVTAGGPSEVELIEPWTKCRNSKGSLVDRNRGVFDVLVVYLGQRRQILASAVLMLIVGDRACTPSLGRATHRTIVLNAVVDEGARHTKCWPAG